MVFNAVTKCWHCNVPFNNKDKAVIKNLYQLKQYGLQRILTEFSKTKVAKG